MNDQLQSLLRTVMQIAAGVLVTKGIGSSTAYETIIAGLLTAIGLFLSYRNSKQKTGLKEDKAILKAAMIGNLPEEHPAVVSILAEPAKKSDPEIPPSMPPKTNPTP